MVERPGLEVRVEPASNWSADGPSAKRALEFARRFVEGLPIREQRSFRIIVERCPPEHTGLGVGTQLGLAVAKAIAVESGHIDWPATDLAKRVGRGERSAIGVHGFDRGGFIVDGGKLAAESLSPLAGRFDFPDDWAIRLFQSGDSPAWHGGREREAILQLAIAEGETNRLCRLVLTSLLPALASRNLEAFGEAVHEFNARVGDIFAPVQGGRYASASVAECVRQLRAIGIRGVGQSSWGPTVFAIVGNDHAQSLSTQVTQQSALVARVSTGAQVEA
jgi:beta-RFAP synthase